MAEDLGDEQSNKIGNYRWVICALLFFATTINYVDRSVMAVMSSTLKDEIHWTDKQYGDINAAFSAAYAIGLLVAGGLIDRFGTRLGYAISLVLWSLASIGHAFVRTPLGFGAARVTLGFFEAGNFPAAVKTVAEWFPKKERALAVGIFNSGANIGAILAPLTVPWLVISFGWEAAFIVTGAAGLIWVLFWWPMYRKPEDHPRLGKTELNYIVSDLAESPAKIAWAKLLPHRQTWAFSIGKFLTDPIWWFWLFWAAPYFKAKFHTDIKSIGMPLVVIYNMATIGSVGGGYLATVFIRAGCNTNVSRKMAMLICGLCVLPVMYAPITEHKWTAVLLIGLAAAAHQGWSANLFALSGDLFPKRAVGSVVGIGGMMGGVAGIILLFASGRIVEAYGYLPLFIIAGSSYMLAILAIQILVPKLEAATIDVK